MWNVMQHVDLCIQDDPWQEGCGGLHIGNSETMLEAAAQRTSPLWLHQTLTRCLAARVTDETV